MFDYTFSMYSKEALTALHRHDTGQLGYVHQGCGIISSESTNHIISNGEVFWIPAFSSHSFRALKKSKISLLLFSEIPVIPQSSICRLIPSVLLVQLLSEMSINSQHWPTPELSSYKIVIVDQLKSLKKHSSTLPLATASVDKRLIPILEQLYSAPNIKQPLRELCQQCGASERTVNRLFQDTFSCSYRHFRHQVVMGKAVQRLKLGDSMTTVALELGYSGLSAFSAAYNQYLVKTT